METVNSTGGHRPRKAGAAGAQSGKVDPRTRMLDAMVQLAGEQGFCDTTVADVISRAGASRKTFYEHFEDIQSCFLVAGDELIRGWLERTRAAVDAAETHGDAMEALVEALFLATLDEPAAVRVLAAELVAAGPSGIDRRQRLMSQLGELVNRTLIGLAEEDKHKSDDPQLEEDSPLGKVLAGAVVRLAYTRARKGAGVRKPRRAELLAIVTDVARWLALYRWAPDPSADGFPEDGSVPPVGGRAPGSLSLGSRASERRGLRRGEGNVSHSFVIHNQRERLLDALANLSAASGYDRVTIPDMVHEAAVSVQAFYEHFSGREDAFLVAYELGHRKLLAIVERAYGQHVDWPSAMRAAIGTILDFLASEPSFAHVALVDSLTAGPKALSVSAEAASAYAHMIEPGLNYHEDGVQRPFIIVEGTVAALVELCYGYVSTEHTRQLPYAIELACHVVLDPFLGAGRAEIHARLGRELTHQRV